MFGSYAVSQSGLGKLLRRHQVFKFTFVGSIALILTMVALPLVKLAPELFQQQSIPLHYNVYFGVDLVGPWYKIFYIPVLGLILFVANTMFEILLYQREHVLSYFFAFGTLFAETVLFAAVLMITLMNL